MAVDGKLVDTVTFDFFDGAGCLCGSPALLQTYDIVDCSLQYILSILSILLIHKLIWHYNTRFAIFIVYIVITMMIDLIIAIDTKTISGNYMSTCKYNIVTNTIIDNYINNW